MFFFYVYSLYKKVQKGQKKVMQPQEEKDSRQEHSPNCSQTVTMEAEHYGIHAPTQAGSPHAYVIKYITLFRFPLPPVLAFDWQYANYCVPFPYISPGVEQTWRLLGGAGSLDKHIQTASSLVFDQRHQFQVYQQSL